VASAVIGGPLKDTCRTEEYTAGQLVTLRDTKYKEAPTFFDSDPEMDSHDQPIKRHAVCLEGGMLF
jgi:hypothetical protein